MYLETNTYQIVSSFQQVRIPYKKSKKKWTSWCAYKCMWKLMKIDENIGFGFKCDIYIARPKTLTIQNMVLFSHLTVQLPSEELSQKHELAVWRPAPFFCIITQVTIYLKGFPSLVSWFRHCSTTFDVHWLTLLCW